MIPVDYRNRAGVLLLAAVCLGSTGPARSEDQEPLAWIDGSATLAVLPDTERYSDDYPDLFAAQTRWIKDNVEKRNIAYVLHLGDITQHNAAAEWDVAKRCFSMLDGNVQYALAAGNHDYEGPNRVTKMNEYFPLRETRKWTTFGGTFEEERIENSYHLFRMAGRDWIVVVLEMGPRDAVVAWANEVLEKHSTHLGILVTHAYLFRGNVRYDHLRGAQRASPHSWGNDGEQLWQKLVRRQPNMMLVLSGHVSTGGTGYLASEGDYGNVVHQVMADYEKGRRGGMAFLRLVEFLPDGKTVQVKTFSPAVGGYLTDEENQFVFELKLANRKTPRPDLQSPSARLSRAPIHRYRFDGAGEEGATIRDSVGKAHGVLEAGGSSSKLDGRGGVVLTGDGHVRLPSGILDGLEDVSFEVWFTATADRYKWNSVVRFGDARDWLTYTFRTRTVHRAEIAVNRHNEDIQREVPVEPGRPLHVIVTYDDDGADGKPLLSYYRDGQLYGTMQTSVRLEDVNDADNVVGPFEGRFDEFRIYDYPLELDEVQGNFTAGPDKVPLRGRRAPTR